MADSNGEEPTQIAAAPDASAQHLLVSNRAAQARGPVSGRTLAWFGLVGGCAGVLATVFVGGSYASGFIMGALAGILAIVIAGSRSDRVAP